MDSIQKAVIEAATKRDTHADYFHSSGYAQAQNGERMGSASLQTFKERQALEAKRQFVRNYRSSQMGTRADGGWRARTAAESAANAASTPGATNRLATPEGRQPVSARQRDPIAMRRNAK